MISASIRNIGEGIIKRFSRILPDFYIKFQWNNQLMDNLIDNNPILRDGLWRERLSGGLYFEGDVFTYYPAYWLYLPKGAEGMFRSCDVRPDVHVMDIVRAYQKSEAYRECVLDENIPNYGRELPWHRDPFFGRVGMIQGLGTIGYWKAAPEIREAMLHDLTTDIRSVSLRSLAEIGDTICVPDVIGILRDDKSLYMKSVAADGLGELKDFRALYPLRETFEDVRRHIWREDGIGKEWITYSEHWRLMIDVLRAMKRIGGELADRTIGEAFDDSVVHIRQAAKRGDRGY
jgi:hypothetical protein